MSKLQDFLVQNKDVTVTPVEVAVSKRFVDENGSPLLFKIRPMTGEEFSEYQRKSTHMSFVGNKRQTSFDSGKFNMLCVINQCMDPCFTDAEFVKMCEVQTPEQAVSKVLLSGEIVELGTQITRISGFDTDIEEKVQEAKN